MGVEEEQDLRELRSLVLSHLPAVPDTTTNFLRRAAAAAPSPSCVSVGSVPSAETLLPGHVSSSWSAPSVSSGSDGFPQAPTSTPLFLSSTRTRTRTRGMRFAPFEYGGTTSCLHPTDACSALSSIFPGARQVLHGDISRDATAVVSEGDAGSTISVSGVRTLELACVSVAVSSDAAAAESSGMTFAGFRSREPKTLADEAISLVFRKLPIRDVFRLGYLFSRRWLEIWQGIPLVVHDVQLASDNDREIMQTGERITMNLAKKISRVLDLHPGPVEIFRIDSSSWKEGNNLQWRVWIHKLISKNVKEIIICGRWPRSLMEFLPNNLAHCRSLQKIYLCFFSVPRVTDNLAFPHLTELGLTHCVFENSDLDTILRNCKLSTLTLGFVSLAILNIQSETLRSFVMWRCSIDILCLSGMPNLLFFHQEPGWNFDNRSHLQLRGIPKLRMISSIFLNQQTVELCGYRIKADMLEYPLCWGVTRLQLVVTFSSENELALIPSLLNCFPKLESLRIYRLDSHENYTGPPIDWQRLLSTVPCIKTSLIEFALCNCRGDDVENDLGNVVLASATKLKDLQIELHSAFV